MDALAIRENVTSNVWNCVINRERENKKKTGHQHWWCWWWQRHMFYSSFPIGRCGGTLEKKTLNMCSNWSVCMWWKKKSSMIIIHLHTICFSHSRKLDLWKTVRSRGNIVGERNINVHQQMKCKKAYNYSIYRCLNEWFLGEDAENITVSSYFTIV